MVSITAKAGSKLAAWSPDGWLCVLMGCFYAIFKEQLQIYKNMAHAVRKRDSGITFFSKRLNFEVEMQRASRIQVRKLLTTTVPV